MSVLRKKLFWKVEVWHVGAIVLAGLGVLIL
jgi:hypothetical protein